ncbi:MAG TPA: serine hydrolase domain-containing protein [Verrucomicrobiae bacterium]|nr:serine hydrolase domain-containing protein [Verrucomicrobiae bacterium]
MSRSWDEIAEGMQTVFDRNFRERGEIGAGISVWEAEREVVSLSGGFMDRERTRGWTSDTLAPVWSATKGPASVACLLAIEEAGLALENRVTEVWPEFGQAGKEPLSFAQLLSHTGGLCALDEKVSTYDYADVIQALEQQAPVFPPGSQVAYHARTFGFLLEEIVRRITGKASLGKYFRERIGAPMNLDFWIGLPEDQFSRVATLYPGKMPATGLQDAFVKAIGTRDSLTQRVFASPAGLHSVQEMNKPDTWELGLASMGGVGSARALAQFYAMLANGGVWQGLRLVSESIIQEFTHTLAQGDDPVVCTPMAFGAGMMRDPVNENGKKFRRLFGSSMIAFGHPGAGGSLAFADPERGFGFAYVMNQMELGVLPTAKALDLVGTLGK